MTMKLIETVTVGAGGAASINFTSIPQGFTDLFIQLSSRDTYNNGNYWVNGYVRFNDVTTGYSGKSLYGDGSSTVTISDSELLFRHESAGQTANTFASIEIYIPNYSSSTHKSVSINASTENNVTLSWNAITAGLWSNTAAITKISLGPTTLMAQYSTASLYGITKGSGGATVS